jgi:hypothetical protein
MIHLFSPSGWPTLQLKLGDSVLHSFVEETQMDAAKFAQLVNLIQSFSPMGDAGKLEDGRQRALALVSDNLADLTDDQLSALLELEREYVRWLEQELRNRNQGPSTGT